jgi:hypothetical protein
MSGTPGDERYYKRPFDLEAVYALQHAPRRAMFDFFMRELRPSPTDTVPVSIRSVPAKVFAPVIASVPAPAWTIVPVPETTFGSERLSERSNTRLALTVTAPVPREPLVPPSPKALAELRKLLEHNDTVARSGAGRVSADAAIEMLRAYGWKGAGRGSLNAVCRQLGRHSYGTA